MHGIYRARNSFIGVVGEILVKFLPAANNYLVETLESEGAEAVPTTWLGRQAKGCVHTIFGAPLWMSSNISPVKNQPSPHHLLTD